MGLLFLSQRASRRAYARKALGDAGIGCCAGIPLLVYDWVLHPLSVCSLMSVGVTVPRLRAGGGWGYFNSFHLGRGPLWFVETLLFFGLVYLLSNG